MKKIILMFIIFLSFSPAAFARKEYPVASQTYRKLCSVDKELLGNINALAQIQKDTTDRTALYVLDQLQDNVKSAHKDIETLYYMLTLEFFHGERKQFHSEAVNTIKVYADNCDKRFQEYIRNSGTFLAQFKDDLLTAQIETEIALFRSGEEQVRKIIAELEQ